MLQRIITSLIGLVIFFAVLFANEIVFTAAIIAVIFIALYELHKAMSADKSVFCVSLLSSAAIICGIFMKQPQAAVMASMMAYLTLSIFLHPKRNFKDVYSAALCTYFITFFFSALITLRSRYGIETVFLVFLFAWGTDTGAYFSGRFFGKHKLIPKVSPKKTIEGSVGGVIFSILLTCLYLAFLKNVLKIENIGGASYMGVSVLSVVASLFSQLGDLAASVIKRDSGVKDFGTVLPGHGGIMDRFDSVVFIAPMVLYYLIYFNRIFG